jgi:hypothetical protein
MNPSSTVTSEFTLTLTEDERAHLLGFLEAALRDKQIEARRTQDPDFHKYVHHEEVVMRQLIEKLRRK